jgi:hypothetical protein
MGPCIVSIFQYISNKMQRYTVYLYLETALHVSGGSSTHHQERTELYLQHLVFVRPLLLPATIAEELELFAVARFRQITYLRRGFPPSLQTNYWPIHCNIRQFPPVHFCCIITLFSFDSYRGIMSRQIRKAIKISGPSNPFL